MWQAASVTFVWENRKSYKVLVQKRDRNISLQDPEVDGEDNIDINVFLKK